MEGFHEGRENQTTMSDRRRNPAVPTIFRRCREAPRGKAEFFLPWKQQPILVAVARNLRWVFFDSVNEMTSKSEIKSRAWLNERPWCDARRGTVAVPINKK
jgi:hypothetical protein